MQAPSAKQRIRATAKKEKQTPYDADDAGPYGQHHLHHWDSISGLSQF